jgi:hypothetical protein
MSDTNSINQLIAEAEDVVTLDEYEAYCRALVDAACALVAERDRLRAENARLREQPVPAHGFEDRWRPQLDGGKRREREKRDDDDAS